MLKETDNDAVQINRQRARQGEYGWSMKWVLGAGTAAFAVFGLLIWFFYLGQSDYESSPATDGEPPALSEPASVE
ncbi:hypothetical protein [Amorphus coralli]|uniref:hypothetical protein n=1 Tax=Amorphus coralli TaxID=340680 RepID=UPI000370110D|nr:hypothetical protein [Amorphus coralli]